MRERLNAPSFLIYNYCYSVEYFWQRAEIEVFIFSFG